MQNKIIINLIVANLLWSFIPVIVLGLFNEVSVLMVIFLRFLVSGVILFLLAILLIFVNNRFTSNKKIPFEVLKIIYTHKNRRFFRLRNIYYFAIMGFFGIIMQLIWYFMALKVTETIALAMIGFQVSIILVALYEHGIKSEKLDIFKILYLLLLVVSIGIIINVKSQEAALHGTGFSLIGLIYIMFFTLSLVFFQISINRDIYSKRELKIANKNQYYKIIRLLIKISSTFLIGVIFMFPFLLIFQLIFPISDLTTETVKFYGEFPNMFNILMRGDVIFLIIFSTILPFLLVFLTSVYWKPYNLTYSQWNSILTLIEPIGALIFGIIFVGEYFPLEYLLVVFFLLIVSILFRYAHELKNIVNACILLNNNIGSLKKLPMKLLKFQGVMSVDTLAGTHDLLLNVKSSSIKDFYYLVNKQIKKLDEVKNIKILFVNEINKLEI